MCVRTGGEKTSENRGANVSRTYSARRYGWHRLRSMRQEKLKIRDYALKLAGGLFETKSSCPLTISVLSIIPDLIVLLASWSGAEATRIHALNTSSTYSASVFSSALLTPRFLDKSRFSASSLAGFLQIHRNKALKL